MGRIPSDPADRCVQREGRPFLNSSRRPLVVEAQPPLHLREEPLQKARSPSAGRRPARAEPDPSAFANRNRGQPLLGRLPKVFP
jgi:hypothetical protein